MIPNNVCPPRVTAAAGTELAGAFLHGTVSPAAYSSAGGSSRTTAVYNPKAVIPHAASLRQAFAHCAKFPTAASRRSLDRISVPVWRIILSDPLDIIALVGRYPANKLMSRRPLFQQQAFQPRAMRPRVLSGISPSFERLSQTGRQVVYVLLTRAPLYSPSEEGFLVRLACVRHAASVRSEPGSNSLV